MKLDQDYINYNHFDEFEVGFLHSQVISIYQNLSLEDEQRPGRPRIWDSEATREAAEQQLSTSTHRLSDTLGPSKSIIHHHLTALGKIYKSCRVVPHELTAEQSQ
jgi:cytochrome c556